MSLYDSPSDVNLRLDSSIIRIGEEPAYVYGVGDTRFMALFLRSREEEEIRFTDDRINIKPVPLGYINTVHYGTTYLTRLPCRRYKQGLHRNNFKCEVGPNIPIFDCFLELGNSILNIFDGVEEALSYASERQGLRAFDRKFAVRLDRQNNFELMYKADAIGTITANGYELYPRFEFLTKFIGAELDEHF